MATFNDAVVTNAGLTLLSDAQAGYITGINFVGARTGNGTYDGTETLAQMTGLKSQKQSFNIDSVSRIGDNTLRLQFTITNKLGASELQVGYDIKELGIYANDGENVILFAIVTADQWDHLNAYDGVMAQTMTISFFLEVSNDTQITITAPNDNDLVTFGALAEALASVNTELPTASASTLGGVKVGDNLSIDENGVLSAVIPDDVGLGIELYITAPTGTTVNATDGVTTVTGTTNNDFVKLEVPNYGTWTISGANATDTTNTVILNAEVCRIYPVTLTYFKANVRVACQSGAVVTITSDTFTQTATSVSGYATFQVREACEYAVVATYQGVNSDTQTVNVAVDGSTYDVVCTFVTLTVNVKTGSSVVVSKGAYSYTKIASNNTTSFYLAETGEWSISCTLNGQVATGAVLCELYGEYEKNMSYSKIFGVQIDMSNSNPSTCITYTDDAIGMTGGSSAWDSEVIFKDIKPCLFKNGVVQGYLKKDDFTKFEDGTSADITSGNSGDVMIEIPKCGYKIATSGNILTVKITDNLNASDDGFCYYAHTRVTEGDCSKLYIGAYLGYTVSNKLRSLSGKTVTANQTIETFRTLAQANGTGYDQVSFYPLTLLQCLYLIKYCNLDSQTALGRGYVDGNSNYASTGGTNAKGMCYGETMGRLQMKLFGIEDFWGNYYWWIDGLFSDGSRNILTAYQNFNDTGSGYANHGQGATQDLSGRMSKPQGSTSTGFIAKEVNGSDTTYWCDYANLRASRLPFFGGDRSAGANAGAFLLYVYFTASYSSTNIAARLMFLNP